MNIRHLLIGFAALTVTVSTSVFADDIYKWTDAEGNVHYEDRPSGEPSEERLQFSYNRTNSTAVQQRVQTQRDVTATRQTARAEAEADQQTAAENRAMAEEQMAKCLTYRGKLTPRHAARLKSLSRKPAATEFVMMRPGTSH